MNAIDPSRAGKYCRPGASNLNASSFKYQKESLERLETNPLICSDRFSQATRRFCIKRGGKGQSHGKDENLKKKIKFKIWYIWLAESWRREAHCCAEKNRSQPTVELRKLTEKESFDLFWYNFHKVNRICAGTDERFEESKAILAILRHLYRHYYPPAMSRVTNNGPYTLGFEK